MASSTLETHHSPILFSAVKSSVRQLKLSAMATEKRGSIAFFSTYRPPVPLDIFSAPIIPTTRFDHERRMTDGLSYNYNGQEIPLPVLNIILKHPKLASVAKEAHIDVSGIIFVSERGNIETLHFALRLTDSSPPRVFSFSDLYPDTFNGVRMEDSGSSVGEYLIYVTTKDEAADRRQPWTAVYKTSLKTGISSRLTPPGEADLSPSVSPSGKRIAVASFENKVGGWEGEIEDLQTNIYVMDVEQSFQRRLILSNAGWPTWGSDNVIFFHSKVGGYWGVFRAEISDSGAASKIHRVTPANIDAITPAALNETTVAVATIRQKSTFSDVRVEAQYRHIEIFDSTGQLPPKKITQRIRPKADHFNPFWIDGGSRIGYHRCSHLLKSGDDIERSMEKVVSPYPDIEVFRVSGVFPTFSKDATKLAFVDNEFKAVWVADIAGKDEKLRIVYQGEGPDSVWAPVWSQGPQQDLLYFSMGHSFNAKAVVDICVKSINCPDKTKYRKVTNGFNNAFPSTNPDGTKMVFRSTRDGPKNLYIMDDIQEEGTGKGTITRLTNRAFNTDTHCQWSPRGDWIVFSSSLKPDDVPDDNNLDPGYFNVFLLNVNDPSVVIRVIGSGNDLAGHVNHPFFSPDGKSIVVSSDFAAISVDPISLPLFVHSVRPYGDIFTIDIDPDNIEKNKDLQNFNRITHSRYENSTCTWSILSTPDMYALWNQILKQVARFTPTCPYMHSDGGESWHMTGHLCIPRRSC